MPVLELLNEEKSGYRLELALLLPEPHELYPSEEHASLAQLTVLHAHHCMYLLVPNLRSRLLPPLAIR